MKKIFSLILSLFIAIGMFSNVIVAETNEELKESVSLGMAKESIFVQDIDETPRTAKFLEPFDLEFTVKEGIEITNCHWLLEGIDYPEPHELTGKAAHSNVLHIPSFATRFLDDLYVECVVDYIDHNDGDKEKTTYTNTAEIHIDDSISKSKQCVVSIGDFAIFPGQSLNLETAQIGTGEIRLSSDGRDLTLDNVNYTYDPDTLLIDRNFTMNYGLRYDIFNNTEDEININLIGENKITNLFRHINSDEDGNTFQVFNNIGEVDFLEDIIIDPTVNLNGPGSLTITGGKYCMYVTGDLCVDTKLNLFSSKYEREDIDTPARIGNGIACVNAIFASNADVNMDIAGNGVEADVIEDSGYGYVDLQEGSKLNIKSTSYIRHPWLETFLPTKIDGIKAGNDVTIDGAEYNVEIITDFDLFRQYNDIYSTDFEVAYESTGIYLSNDYEEPTSIDIKNSKVSINTKTINSIKDEEYFLVRTYGIRMYDFMASTMPVLSSLNIENSDVDINIGENGNVYDSYGIYIKNGSIVDSDLKIKALANETSYGMFVYEDSKNVDKYSSLLVENSKVDIDAKVVDDELGIAYGSRLDYVSFEYDDSDSSFVTKGKDGALLCRLGTGTVERTNEDNYAPKRIELIDDTKVDENYPINVISLAKKLTLANQANDVETKSIEKSQLFGATKNYYYYETLLNNKEIATTVTITGPTKEHHQDDKPKYVIPQTGIN